MQRVSLGLWVFRSKSSQNDGESPRGACKGYIFALEVTEELVRWPEQDTHGRRWVSPEDAFRLCRYDWMRKALAALLDRWQGEIVQCPGFYGGSESKNNYIHPEGYNIDLASKNQSA
ncbi:hypothetical protein E2562_014988 [Oryza meyeriana var. granulata]|uniref:Nudix hydrolase domain-containing protein n=1 Tax=Oryza meyeriana var. granulata TaxID=110450 RepID=A0A6G1EKH6_9ORYZ|nr:hypothetical protein E2562_014988 [Oryza meyeriana var. granulata]